MESERRVVKSHSKAVATKSVATKSVATKSVTTKPVESKRVKISSMPNISDQLAAFTSNSRSTNKLVKKSSKTSTRSLNKIEINNENENKNDNESNKSQEEQNIKSQQDSDTNRIDDNEINGTNETNDDTTIVKSVNARNTKKIAKKGKMHFNFKKNKSGTYSIYNGKWKRINYKLIEAYLPFGVEVYNDISILNVYFRILTNSYHHNFLVLMREMDAQFQSLKNNKMTPFDLTDLEYQNIIKENHFVNNEGDEDMRYFMRCHLATSVKIHSKSFFGNYDKKALKGKRCNIRFDIGSIHMHPETKIYGCTLYITDIEVIN